MYVRESRFYTGGLVCVRGVANRLKDTGREYMSRLRILCWYINPTGVLSAIHWIIQEFRVEF